MQYSYSYRFMLFPNGKPKSVTFSFDDGSVFDKPLVETLDKYGIKCTFNISICEILLKVLRYYKKRKTK